MVARIVGLSTLLFAVAALAQPKIEEYYDKDFGYSFQYPEGWRLQRLPEGDANRDMRVLLQGPNGSSFMAIVEKHAAKVDDLKDQEATNRKERVESLISQTIEAVYKPVAENIKSLDMSVGERLDISNDTAIKFYISTLDKMPDGKSIVVAGIHSFPFGKDYAVSFIMSASWDGKASKEQEILTAVFNSFRLVGERPADATFVESVLSGAK